MNSHRIIAIIFVPRTLCPLAFLSLLLLSAGIQSAYAQSPGKSAAAGGVSGAMEIEIQRRLNQSREAGSLLGKGDGQMAEKDYTGAVDTYRQALALLPDAPMVGELRKSAMEKFASALVAYARQLGSEGSFEEADAALGAVLNKDMLPNHKEAMELKKDLKDPTVFNPAISKKFQSKLTKVRRLLELAGGFLELGDFKSAEAAYNQILDVDAHNVAARRGLEKCSRLKTDYDLATRDHMRAKSLNAVDAQWFVPVPESTFVPKLSGGPDAPSSGGNAGRLRSIVLPKLAFEGATLSEAVEYVVSKARALDPGNPDTGRSAWNMLVKIPPQDQAKLPNLTLTLADVPLHQALDYMAQQTGTKWQLTDGVVVFTTMLASSGKMSGRSFQVPPGFLSSATVANAADTAQDPFTKESQPSNGLAITKVTARSFLESSGVPFPPGSTAGFDRNSSRLLVTNTEENLDLVQTIVDQLGSKVTKMAQIRVKMIKLSEQHLGELGYDWLLGQFPITDRVFGSGGTFGERGAPTTPVQNYPFVDPGVAAVAVPTGSNPVTAGLRGLAELQTQPSIDDLISGNGRGIASNDRSPGIFGLAGPFTSPQFQMVLRALNQKKSSDILASTEIVVKSGQIASAKSVREVPFPTDFDPPTIPQSFGAVNDGGAIGGGGGVGGLLNGGGGNGINSFPVTPTTPTAFDKREVGQILEAEATISEDGKTIDLRISPEFVEFVGFINYGSPIQTNQAGRTLVLTENRIVQPVFDTVRTVGTALTVYDGSTIAFGGLTQVKSNNIEDKVPFLGDLPLIGPLFRSKAQQTSRSAVILFVTVNIIDPAGRKFREEPPH